VQTQWEVKTLLQDEDQHPAKYLPPRKTILLVADNTANANMLSHVISRETTHHVFLAPNSQAALHFVKHLKPNLLIVDCRHTFENGIELYDRLHALPGLEAIPAIILTASLEQYADDIQARNLIALSNPFDLDDFLSTLEEVLRCSSNEQLE
jgi:CheY-like chemotaxis protein